MCATNDPITTYQIAKDIVIPILGILSTLTIGIVIAILLKRREENSKVKSLLIDSYMDYLNKRSRFVEYESVFYTYEILKDMYINYEQYFDDHANRHMPKEQIEKFRDNFRQHLDSINQDESNWSVFTYKFCFLLGTKKYKRKAQIYENKIVNEIINESSKNKFITELKLQIKSNEEIKRNMNAVNLHMIRNGIDIIVRLIAAKYSEYQLQVFKPYDNIIADLIDKK